MGHIAKLKLMCYNYDISHIGDVIVNSNTCCFFGHRTIHETEELKLKLVEIIEMPEKRWYIGVQYHPEYSSTVLSPNPLIVDFVKAAIAFGAEK